MTECNCLLSSQPCRVHDRKPEQPQGDVIERMHRAYWWRGGTSDYRLVDLGERMTAAAKVLLDEAMGPVTPDEIVTANVEVPQECGLSSIVNHVLRSRRARILPAKPDAAVEAVRALIDEHFATWREDVSAKRRETVEKIVAAVDKARGRG